MQSIRSLLPKETLSFSLSSDFTIYTTQAQVEKKRATHTQTIHSYRERERKMIHGDFVDDDNSRLSVSIREQNDHQHLEHGSLRVDVEIREGIYARKTTSMNSFNEAGRRTFRSRGIRPSDSSFARAARRLRIRLYCLALTYNGSSSVGSDDTADWDWLTVVAVCIWTVCNWPELPGTI